MVPEPEIETEDNREGCWHYDYEMFCTQCDPAMYGPCEPDCDYNHEHNTDDDDDTEGE